MKCYDFHEIFLSRDTKPLTHARFPKKAKILHQKVLLIKPHEISRDVHLVVEWMDHYRYHHHAPYHRSGQERRGLEVRAIAAIPHGYEKMGMGNEHLANDPPESD